MDKESAQLLKIVVIGFAIIVAYLLWAALTETKDPIVMLWGNSVLGLI